MLKIFSSFLKHKHNNWYKSFLCFSEKNYYSFLFVMLHCCLTVVLYIYQIKVPPEKINILNEDTAVVIEKEC